MVRKLLLAGLATGALVPAVGCRTAAKKSCDRCPPPPIVGRLGDPVPPPRFSDTIPPPAVPTAPAPSGGGSLPPPVVPESQSYRIDPTFPPPAIPKESPAPTPAPRDAGKELLLPDPLPGSGPAAKPSASGFLEAPVRPGESSATPAPPPAKPAPTADLPAKSPVAAPLPTPNAHTAKAPVGLPGFAAVADKPGVFAGRKPTLDGFDWLKGNGFRSVVYLHAPAADTSAARDLVERRSLRFVPVSVSPATLADAARSFNEAVADRAARPTYVCDDDGSRAGILWFLHFRTVDLLSDDAARVRATPLGLRGADTEADKQMWVAAQDYLAKRP